MPDVWIDRVFVFLSSSSSIYLFKRDSCYFLFFITALEVEVSVIRTIDQQQRLPTPVDFSHSNSHKFYWDQADNKLAHMHILSIL